jgi:hypothetical protein
MKRLTSFIHQSNPTIPSTQKPIKQVKLQYVKIAQNISSCRKNYSDDFLPEVEEAEVWPDCDSDGILGRVNWN